MARKRPASGGGKTYGSSQQSCPRKGKKGSLTIAVMDANKKPLSGVSVQVRDKDGTIKKLRSDGSGFAEAADLPVGPCTITIQLDDKEQQLYLEPLPDTTVADPGGGFSSIILHPLKKVITPNVRLERPRLLVDPVKKSSEPVVLTLQLEDSAPKVTFKCDGKLVRSGAVEVYTDAGCGSALTFSGDEVIIPGADLASPKEYWIKGTAAGRATFTLHGDPKETKPNVSVGDDDVEGIDLFTPDVTPKLTAVPATLVSGGTRAMTINYRIDDAERIGKEAVLEVVDKYDAVVKELKKLTLPGDNSGGMTVAWDGKGSGEPDYDKNPYTVRLTVTDTFTRKTKDEKPTRLVKPGSIVSAMVHSAKSTEAGKDGTELSGVTLKVIGTTSEGPSKADGTYEHKDLVPQQYTVEAKLSPALAADFELLAPTQRVTVDEGAAARCEIAVDPLATVKVKLKSGTTNIPGAKIKLSGTKVVDKDTGGDGVADFGVLPIGPYTIDVEYVADSDNAKKYMVPAATALQLARGVQAKPEIDAVLMPALKVTVQCVAITPNRKLETADVKITSATGKILTAKTTAAGEADFPHVPVEELKIDVSYTGDNAKNFEVPAQATFTPVAGTDGAKAIDVELKKCPVVIKLMMKMADGTEHQLPKDLKIKLRLDDDKLVEGKLDDKGVIVDDTAAVMKVPRIQKFSVEIPKTANSYFVVEKTGVTPTTQELIVDAAPKLGSTLGLLITAGKRAMLLPQEDVKLVELDADVAPADHYAKPSFDFKDKELIGTDVAPVKLLVKPKWQYVRFEYFDRRHGKADHGAKRISIPPVLLKAARKTTAGEIGAVETASSFTIDDADNAKACQALPWLVVNKKADGTPLDKLTNELHLEFGQADAWVEATSATERKIVKLDRTTDKDKIAPGKDRDKLYDLPKIWKSCNYYTRLPGDTGKFFDELTEAEIEGSYDKSKPLTFSLDDVVLTPNDGTDLKDQKKDGAFVDLSKHARFAILYFDPDDADDPYKVKIHEPRPEAVYHTNLTFTKEAAVEKYRNHIAKAPATARVVTFCNGFYDVFDKRTETAEFAKKQIWGARLAKLGDGDVSLKKNFGSADVTEGYTHKAREIDCYYLHYGATDGTTVYGAVLTYWTGRFFSLLSQKPVGWDPDGPPSDDPADMRNYRKEGMAHAMKRWNEKNYQLEQEDKTSKDFKIKLFALFEAKDVEDPVNTFHEVGGKHMTLCSVGDDNDGSWATDTTMHMRRSGYRDEGGGWGSHPGVTDAYSDYGGAGAMKCALAHELGHAAIGLWDDYVTEKLFNAVGHFKTPQRYPGMPFKRDANSLMNSNQATRVRMLWGRTRWVNDEAKTGKNLHKFLGGKKFSLTYAPAGKTKLWYALPDSTKNFYFPHKKNEGENQSWGEKGKGDLVLYPLGNDEFANSMKDGPYDGMLVVDTRMAVVFERGLTPAADAWKDAVAYTKGKCVDHLAEFYACLEDHTSSADFTTDATKWAKIDKLEDPVAYAFGTNVVKDKWLSDSGNHYYTLSAHKSGAPSEDKHWIKVGASRAGWQAAQAYVVGDEIRKGMDKFVCQTGHTSATWASEGGNWIQKPASATAHANATNYAVGGLVTSSGSTFICKTAHKSGVEADVEAGKVAKCTSKPTADWTDPQKKDFVVKVDGAFTKAVEGPEGKFRLICQTADAKFSKTYIRTFPQFFFKATTTAADPVGRASHYTVVAKLGGSKGFGPAAYTVKMGSECDKQTMVRYMYGLLSDDWNTRKTQDVTAELTAADMAPFKTWIEGREGDARPVQSFKPPEVTSMAPPTGRAEGENVVITGKNFTGTTGVKFGTVAQPTFTVDSDTQITVAVPASAVKGKIEVKSGMGAGLSAGDYKILPKITEVKPPGGAKVGDPVEVIGTTLTGATSVKLGNGTQNTVTVVSATKVTCNVPAGATTGKVTITTPDGSAESAADTKILPGITGLEPATAVAIGDTFKVNGTNLAAATSVKVNGVAVTAIASNSADQIQATVPVGAATGTVEVVTADGTATSATPLTVTPP